MVLCGVGETDVPSAFRVIELLRPSRWLLLGSLAACTSGVNVAGRRPGGGVADAGDVGAGENASPSARASTGGVAPGAWAPRASYVRVVEVFSRRHANESCLPIDLLAGPHRTAITAMNPLRSGRPAGVARRLLHATV
jgi:hypothetical protein